MIKIIAPIRNERQFDLLVRSGAGELYGGIYSNKWAAEYGEMIEFNRRGSFGRKANIASFDELARILELCNDSDIPFYLTMNAIFISEWQTTLIQEILNEYKKCGGQKVIVSDPTVMRIALEKGCEITTSSCIGIYNSATAKFWVDAGARRLILPRNIEVEDIAVIKEVCPSDTEVEVFIMNTMCKYSDSMCRSLHNTEYGAFCSFYDHRKKSYISTSGDEIIGKDASSLLTHSFLYSQLYTGNCSLGCGQCALWDLIQVGIDSLKIVGRLLDQDLLAKQICLTANNIKIAKSCSSRKEYLMCMKTPAEVMSPGICRNGYNCYYRSIRR